LLRNRNLNNDTCFINEVLKRREKCITFFQYINLKKGDGDVFILCERITIFLKTCNFLSTCAMWEWAVLVTFQRNVLPPSSGLKSWAELLVFLKTGNWLLLIILLKKLLLRLTSILIFYPELEGCLFCPSPCKSSILPAVNK
jgi:hypothetical protein